MRSYARSSTGTRIALHPVMDAIDCLIANLPALVRSAQDSDLVLAVPQVAPLLSQAREVILADCAAWGSAE